MKLVEFDQSKQLPQEKFYTNGFELVKLDSGYQSTNDRMSSLLEEMLDGCAEKRLHPGFSWEQTASNVFHLRPNVKDYDSVFLDFLWDNQLHHTVEELTGRRMHLCHAQVVVQTPGPPHQDWHRDSYQYADAQFVGASPAAVKVNFYPRFDKIEPRLKFIRGSHRCQVNDARFDAMLLGKYEHEILMSDNSQVLLFDSSMLHAVVPDQHTKGSIRVMYSFAMEHEYEKRFANKESHRKLHDAFEEYYEKC